ncbi:MAG: ATP-binding cassette domain-containing protein [Acidimicrobiia bacterium]|nr:ATP-binding cassette domain-containing protein [Acidimicrobiia bacterium]
MSQDPVSQNHAVVARGLVKRYGSTTALAGIDLEVPTGTVTAVLGPNGAGKTTAVRILTTLSEADEGRATVAGFDVRGQPTEVRRRIGLAAQDATVDHLLTGRENLVMLGELHQLSRKESATRASELLDQFSLADAADRVASGYSGGMRRRLDLAATLVARPEVLFLDEPTTGLDPRARSELWGVLDTLVDRGTTILLTTQYLEEAERLADDIIVIDHGRIIARGDARKLKREVGGDHVQVVVIEPDDLAEATRIVTQVTGTEPTVDAAARSVTAATSLGVETLVIVAKALTEAQISVDDLSLRQPTLDEVFLTLTGAVPEDEGAGTTGQADAPGRPDRQAPPDENHQTDRTDRADDAVRALAEEATS